MRGNILRSAGVAFAFAFVACSGADPSGLFTPPDGDDAPASADGPTADSSPSDASGPMDSNTFEVMPEPDTGPPDTGPPAPAIFCGHAGKKDCPATVADCCVVNNGASATYKCQDPAAPTACTGGVPVFCESAVDCPGQVCCGTQNGFNQYIDVRCLSDCSGTTSTQVQFCDPNAVPAECQLPFISCGPSTLLPGYNVCQ